MKTSFIKEIDIVNNRKCHKCPDGLKINLSKWKKKSKRKVKLSNCHFQVMVCIGKLIAHILNILSKQIKMEVKLSCLEIACNTHSTIQISDIMISAILLLNPPPLHSLYVFRFQSFTLNGCLKIVFHLDCWQLPS